MVSTAKSTTNSNWSGTFGYVGVAVACLAFTGLMEWSTHPPKIEEFGKVGQEFYPEFTDPTLASGLEVFVFDEEEVRARDFKVAKQPNGLWVIPSHHNYPADAEERLAKTASSIIGIKRGALVTRWNADHGRYGVINPKQDSLNVEDVEGVGKRLILRKEDDSVLADFIIGDQVDDKTDEYYVRHPEEDEVYIAKLEIDLSTKFTDWIDDKLFDFSSGDVLQLDINDYVFDDRTITESIVTKLSRDEPWGSDWTMEAVDPKTMATQNALDPATQEVETQKISDALNALSGLEVVGVRPKQKGLTPDLKLDREYLRMQAQLQMLQEDLLARGFALQPGDTNDTFSLISREGELIAGTAEGLRYQMYFGRVFTGSQEELEIGFGDSDADADAADTPEAGAENEQANDDADASGKPGRYLFVRVSFDETLLDGPASAPIEPEKPARLRELEAAEKEQDTADDETTEDTTEEATEDTAADDAAAADEATPEKSELEILREEYEAAQSQYQSDLRDYESRQEKIKTGEEKAEEINRRFAEWYYVIPGESFEKLEVSRADLIKVKETSDDESDASSTGPAVVPPFVPPAGADALPVEGDEEEAVLDATDEPAFETEAVEEETVEEGSVSVDDETAAEPSVESADSESAGSEPADATNSADPDADSGVDSAVSDAAADPQETPAADADETVDVVDP